MFARISLITVFAIYFLILVGGIVRSTGSGMGCPDWPKCFGSYIPPTNVDQLPENYKEVYASKRERKNIRFAGLLQTIGMEATAEKILNDESILEEADFNVFKTWTEYINRLIGAIIGLLILITAIVSLQYRKSDPVLTILSWIALVLLLIQAWLGSVVVSTNLLPWLITVHMVLALVIVLLLIYVHYRSKIGGLKGIVLKDKSSLKMISIFCIVLLLVQVILGTQVRESVDNIAAQMNGLERMSWVNQLGISFMIHRSFSILLLIVHALLIKKIYDATVYRHPLRNVAIVIGIVISLEIVSGIIMAYFGIPAFLQPLHLLFGTLLVGLVYYGLLIIQRANTVQMT
ncbi:MAG: heme A synthase [Cyclobacteriaceae bacterium]